MATTSTINFSNSNPEPIYIQVEPWCGCYVLRKGERITFIAESDFDTPEFDIYETNSTRVLEIVKSTEYFVVVNGKKMHWRECTANLASTSEVEPEA